MINWRVDEKKFKKKYPEDYKLWRLTQLINYGLDGEKLDKKEIIKAWPKIEDKIDPNTKIFFNFLLWGKNPSSKNITKTFWNLS